MLAKILTNSQDTKMSALATTEEKDKIPPIKRDASMTINQPEIDEKTAKPTKRAITDPKQAHGIATALRKQGEATRINRNAVIARKYSGVAPFSDKALKDAGQDWRSNFSTNFLGSIVDRIKPQFVDALQHAKYLTNSSLPTSVQDAKTKSKRFREIITKTIRGWSGWQDFISMLAQEEVLYGYATPCWLDRNEWRPRLFKSNEAFFPEGTEQNAAKVQCFMVEQELLIHEFVELFDNKVAAEKNGYDVANCVEIANEAYAPKEKNDMDRADEVRDGYFSASFNAEQKVIELQHVLVVDFSGEIDIWTVDKKKGRLVRKYENLYSDSMSEATCLFTIQTGNAKLYGSKGMGRLLVNLHIAIERGRCLAADQAYMGAMVILLVEEKDKNSVTPVVRHPFIVLPKGVELSKERIEFSADNYLAMDQKLVEIAESIAGSFVAPQVQTEGSSRTKIEAAQKVEREERVKQGVLSRFNVHADDLVETMKIKICSPLNMREAMRRYEDIKLKERGGIVVVSVKAFRLLKRAFSTTQRKIAAEAAYESKIADTEAVEAIVEMLKEGLTIEEIAMLATKPSSDTLVNESADNDAQTVEALMAALQTANPYINAKEATRTILEIKMGDDRTERVMIADEDQTIVAEATRLQQTEFHDMMDGDQVPVSPRDNHAIHRQVLYPKMGPIMAAIQNPGTLTPEMLGIAKSMLQHAHQHAALDPLMMQNPDAKKKEDEMLGVWDKAVAAADKELAKQQAMGGGANMPAPMPGQPMLNTTGSEQPSDLEHLATAGDLALRAHEQELRANDQQLKAQELQHKIGMDKAGLVLKAHDVAHKQAQDQHSAASTEHDAIIQQAQLEQSQLRDQASIEQQAQQAKLEADRVAIEDKKVELAKTGAKSKD